MRGCSDCRDKLLAISLLRGNEISCISGNCLSFIDYRQHGDKFTVPLKELNLTEGRGTGIPKIIKAMKANGSPPPQFETDEGRTFFAAIYPIHPQSVHRPQPESQPESELQSMKVRVLSLVAVGPLSKSEISKDLGQKKISGQLKKIISDLLAGNQIEWTIPDKPQSRLQKYRITAGGRKWLAKGG